MSIARGMPGILLPADPGFRETRLRAAREGRLRHSAYLWAALTHAAAIALVVVQWPLLFPVAPNEKPPIPVTLVQEVPAPPPQAKPAPPPPPPAADNHELVSGKDTETTAPPQAPEKAAEAAPKPTPPPPLDSPAPSATAAAKPDTEELPHPTKPKLASRETAPKESRVVLNRAPGEEEHEGDPYLNRVNALLNARYHYPVDAIGPLGLHLEGTVVVLLGVLPDGNLQGISIMRSSGSPVLDQEAVREIEEAAPFPPPPAYLQRGGMALLERDVHYFPGAS